MNHESNHCRVRHISNWLIEWIRLWNIAICPFGLLLGLVREKNLQEPPAIKHKISPNDVTSRHLTSNHVTHLPCVSALLCCQGFFTQTFLSPAGAVCSSSRRLRRPPHLHVIIALELITRKFMHTFKLFINSEQSTFCHHLSPQACLVSLAPQPCKLPRILFSGYLISLFVTLALAGRSLGSLLFFSFF